MDKKREAGFLAKVLNTFAENYVIKFLRPRFIHEALKYPDKLEMKIANGSLFSPSLSAYPLAFPKQGHCLYFTHNGFKLLPWSDLSPNILHSGYGELVISADGQWFWSCTEAYTGQAKHYHATELIGNFAHK